MNNSKPSIYKRRIAAARVGQFVKDPKKILTPKRIDLASKTLFARAYIEGNKSIWPEQVYKETLRAWNGFFEDIPLKTSYQDFKDSFVRMIDDYKNNNMNHTTSPVLMDKSFRMLRNGGHRVAAAICTNEYVNVKRSKLLRDRRDWGVDFFRGKLNEKPESILHERYLDSMTLEYVSLKPDNLYAIVIFPSANGNRAEARRKIERLGDIVNHKAFRHDTFDPMAVVRQLYYGESWNYEGSPGLSNKADWCFSGSGDLEIFIVETTANEKKRIKFKQRLRRMWGVDKSSIHITDTSKEVNIVSRMFFHENTRKILHKYHFFSADTLSLFEKYEKHLPSDFIERDNFCIDSSAVMDFFGIRQASDLDYLSRSKIPLSKPIKGVEEHTGEYVEYYDNDKDDMIVDPKNHFYYAGCKLLDIKLVMNMKKNRSKKDPESKNKDTRDILMIEEYLR